MFKKVIVKASIASLLTIFVFSLSSFAIPVPTADAVAVYSCAEINGQTGGGPTLVYAGRYVNLKAGETFTADITFMGATKVTLETPSGNVVGTLVGNGRLSYTFATDVYDEYIKVNSDFDGVYGFAYSFSCGKATTGPDMVEIPSQAVVGTFVVATSLSGTPGGVPSEFQMQPGQTLWVFGVDSTGMYYKVLLSGQSFWVPVSSMGPNFDEVWNGAPLPTTVVD